MEEDLKAEAQAAARFLLPFLLADPPELPQHLASDPVLLRQQWLDDKASQPSAGSVFTNNLYCDPDRKLDEVDTNIAIEAVRHVFEQIPDASESIAFRGPPLFRRPEPNLLLAALQLETGDACRDLTLLLLHEPQHTDRKSTFAFCNLVPVLVRDLPGQWSIVPPPPPPRTTSGPEDLAEYHLDGDDFWDGVSDSHESTGPPAVDTAQGTDDAYWSQYDAAPGEGPSAQAGNALVPHQTSPSDQPDNAASEALARIKALLEQAWDSTAVLCPCQDASSHGARRDLLFSLLSDVVDLR
ncbi:hypothetical protein OC846_003115 [Tilletia horrida]|uniref:Uncharacterized protein n=1 Tax=Tilletia horrida TaxID=155126 RepID=A0AAN6JSC8_9BASI|nr:hypothetical protein OC846_003115 [Tilletia horrida]KAK0554078.1 hypothetical protein OC845_000892 [Tilletia horrida]KAK0565511.1 hypothetical protein OC861_003734 [Tilletia horrida]